jgi:hypothetical protein
MTDYTRAAAKPRLPFAFGLWLIVMFVTALIRQSEATQLTLAGDVYVSWQFVAMAPFALWGLPSSILRIGNAAPVSFLLSGPVFFLYALVVDSFRGGDFKGALLVDSAHVLLPILAAIGLFGVYGVEQRHRMGQYLVVTLTILVSIYAVVALLVHTFDFGDLVTARPPGHENMTFVRLSGPLGVSTGLSLILLPALAFCWQEARRGQGHVWFWRIGAALHVLFIIWTGSRLAPLFLIAMLLFAGTSRQILLTVYLAVIGVFALNLPEVLIPEKWVRLGFSDAGRSMALDTTVAALASGWDAILLGVGSQRLNVLSQTVAQVARGQMRFDNWITEFGAFPYGPHSVLLWSLGSYGILGAALRCPVFLAPAWRIVRRALASPFSASRIPLTMFAVVVSSAGFFFDDSHITHPYLMCIWYLFCFIGIDDLNGRVGNGAIGLASESEEPGGTGFSAVTSVGATG